MARKSDSAAASRPKSKSVSPLKGLWPFLRPYKGLMAGTAVALLVASMATLALPMAVRRMIDFGFTESDSALVDNYFGMLLLVAVVLALATAARYLLVTWLGERVVADLRAAVYAHVTRLSPAFFETTRTGEVLSRLTTDATVIQDVVGSSASIALRNMLLLCGGLTMLFVTSARLTLLVLCVVPLVIGPIMILGRRVRALSRETQDRIADTSALAEETLGAIRTVQAFTHEEESRRRFSGAVELSFAAAFRRARARALLTAIVIFLVFGAIVGILWMGASDVLSGRMTGGALGQFVLYAVFVAGAVGALAEVWGELQRAAGAAERLIELLNAAPEVAAPAAPTPLPKPARGEVRFENVAFRYPTRPDAAALHDFSLNVDAGETLALVGPSGAGKTTVFQLLQRFYDPQAGRVRIDGVAARDADPREWRRRIAVVPQEPAIFSTSVAENIRFGEPGASMEAVRAAAAAAGVNAFVHDLPQGFDTPLGERGVLLSGGQKQRIAIARAVLRDAPILLLDEATSALDAESEQLVQRALERLMANRTTLVIAHRLATVQKAGRILVLRDGRIVEEGSHGALVAAGGLYARLAALQFTDAARIAAA